MYMDEEQLGIILATLLTIIVLCCLPAHGKRDKRIDIEIPVSCVKKVLLVDCDASVNPPKCKLADVSYSPASCAVIHLE